MRDFETILVEHTTAIYPDFPGSAFGIPFEGINTSQHFISTNSFEEMKKIKPTLDKELTILEEDRVGKYQLKDSTKKKVLVVRKIHPEIAKALGLVAGGTSALFVNPMPTKNEITKKYEFGVYGYKSIIVTEK